MVKEVAREFPGFSQIFEITALNVIFLGRTENSRNRFGHYILLQTIAWPFTYLAIFLLMAPMMAFMYFSRCSYVSVVF